MALVDALTIGALAEAKVFITLIVLLLLPGYAFLSISQFGQGLSRLCCFAWAIGLSVSFYPVLFYNLRFWLPSLQINRWMLGSLLIAFGALILFSYRHSFQKHVDFFKRPSWLGVAAFFVVSLTVFTRLWVAHLYPVPAWADSVHHVLITQLTVQQGQLAASLEPYYPINLTMYHLGLYSISASVEWLSGESSHVSLQWTAQMLNGLCGLGIYLLLEPRVGKVGAITGAIVAGLLSHQPAYYVNWGRYTQIASQTILLIGWAVVLKELDLLINPDFRLNQWHKRETIGAILFAGLLSAGIFLLHFRIAALYIALLTVSIPWYFVKAYQQKRIGALLLYLAAVGAISLILIVPTLWQTLIVYASLSKVQPVITDPAQIAEAAQNYYVFPWSSISALAARYWLLIAAGIGTLIGVARRTRVVVFTLFWVLIMFGIGNSYLLDITLLKVTNMGTILIMLYLPVSLLIGAAIGELDEIAATLFKERAHLYDLMQKAAVLLLLVAGFYGAWQRIHDIESGRYFVQKPDLAAMDWINENVPEDSTIAVNTIFWLPGTPHGIDAGYWIPYFTQRKITAGPMLLFLAPYEYRIKIIEASRSVVNLENDLAALKMLEQLNLEYIFVGALSRLNDTRLSVRQLEASGRVEEVFSNGESTVLRIVGD